MAAQIRLFIAIPVSQRLLTPAAGHSKLDADASLCNVISDLRSFGRGVKVVSTDSMHVTLKFIGDVEQELVPQISAVLHDVAATESAFDMPVIGLGAFPDTKRPSVIWAGLTNTEACARMKTSLEDRLAQFGIAPEERAFRPHLTLARVKARPPQELFQMLADGPSTRFGREHVRAIELVKSELKPSGPKYTTLMSAPLNS